MSICLTYTWLFLYLVAEKYNQLIEFHVSQPVLAK